MSASPEQPQLRPGRLAQLRTLLGPLDRDGRYRALTVALDLALQPAHAGGQSIRAIADDPGGPLRDFPTQTRTQPLVWSDLTQHAAGRMAEAMRTGQCWNPRTPAEEAVVHVAVSYGYTDIAFDLIGVDDDLRATGRPPGRQHPTRCPDPGAGGGLHLR